jgi:hypothetical protein
MIAPLAAPVSERRIVRLFACVALLLPIQYVVIRKAGEFYPAIFMPSFAGNPVDAAGNFSYRAGWLEVSFRDGGRDRIDWSQVFVAPPTHAPAVAATSLGSGRPLYVGDIPAPGWWQRNITPGYAPARLRRDHDLPVDPPTLAWLQARLQELFPGRTPAHATLVWRTLRFTYRNGGAQPAAGPADELTRQLDF